MVPPGLSQAMHSNIIDQRGQIIFWKKRSLLTSRGPELTKVLGISCGALSSERVFSPCEEQGRGIFFSYAIPTGDPHKPQGEVWQRVKEQPGVKRTWLGDPFDDTLRSTHRLVGC